MLQFPPVGEEASGFGALDAHTLSSNFSNISLDNYVYTLESFIEAKNLLSERGLIIVGYYLDRTWIGARLSGLLAQGMNPGAGLAFLIAGPTTTLPAMVAVWGLASRRVFALYVSFSLVGAVVLGYVYSVVAGPPAF